ncbi:NAD(P)-dependent oxidoreductase [Deferribacter autotrophicus]|uniref:NAD(P)-dependent oxidoreductase n=1 Tax=Deferribacter autotrophicus TaxID=500465 RepID=A0A5A8F723_9BACT|nr:NAD(P)-dependent oxidoreductase [Deferribacter autotrophicus]KAA0257626.1 NAD(P)-dependent oxidoreductase [Deferribacter autotrophicus]
MKTILITGATGFLGSHLTEQFLKDRYKVIILKRSYSNIWGIKDFIKDIIFYDIDRIDLETVFKENKIDFIVHTATLYGRKNERISEIVKANLNFPLEILELAVKFNIKYFINTDTTLPKNTNSYSLSKYQFKEWLFLFSDKLKVLNIKLEHFYGEKDDKTKFVIWIIEQLTNNVKEIKLTQGEQKRDFIYIEDVKTFYSFLLQSIENFGNGFYEYEIGSGKATTIKELVLKIKELTGNTETNLNFGAIPYRKNEIMFSQADISKAKKDFGWEPKYSLEKGLKRTINWYRGIINEKTI